MRLRRWIVALSACSFLASLPAAISARQASQSAADAARKAKEQKQAAKAKVWTNDDLPTAPTVSVVGEAPQQGTEPGGSAAKAATPSSNNSAGLTSERDKTAAELAQAKKDLNAVKTDLDLAQRTYKLDSDQYYSAPDYADNEQGKAGLNGDKDQVSAKQQAVDAAQKKVDDLQKQLDTLNEKLKATPNASQQKG